MHILTKIQGIPLPENQGEFFEDIPEDELQIPKASKLTSKNFKNNPNDPNPKTLKLKKEELPQKKDK